jgi:hypothetical protein
VDRERDYIEIFERYFEGAMTPEERQAFENTLASQSELNLQFQTYKAIRKSLAIEKIKQQMIAKGVGLSKNPTSAQLLPKGREAAGYLKWLGVLLFLALVALGVFLWTKRQSEKLPFAPPAEEGLEWVPSQDFDSTQVEPVFMVEALQPDSPTLYPMDQAIFKDTQLQNAALVGKESLPNTPKEPFAENLESGDAIPYLGEWVLTAIDLLPDGPSATRGNTDRALTQAEELYPLIKDHLKKGDWKSALKLADSEVINPDDRDWIQMIAMRASGQQERALLLLKDMAEDRAHTYQMEAEALLDEF